LRGLDPTMVRNGTGASEITINLDQATIQRITPADGSKETLLVSDPKTGKPIEQAKDFLRTLCGSQVFRPIEWVRLGGGEPRGKTERLRAQRDQLLAAMPMTLSPEEIADAVLGLGEECQEALAAVNLDGVDCDGHALVVCAAVGKACYDYRKLQNERADDAENELKLIPAPETNAERGVRNAEWMNKTLEQCLADGEEASQAYHRAMGAQESRQTVMRRREEIRARIAQDGKTLPARKSVARLIEDALERIDQGRIEVTRLREALKAAEETMDRAKDDLASLKETKGLVEAHEARQVELAEIEKGLGGAQGDAGDLERLKTRLEETRVAYEARRAQDRHDAAADKAVKARKQSEHYDALVKLFRDDLPRELMGKMAMPVEGLSVEEETIKIHDVPLHQLGTSEQIRVGVQIAAALNTRTGFILVDGAESMGREDKLALARAAHELGLQLIMTFVDADAKPAEGNVVMRKGERVKAVA